MRVDRPLVGAVIFLAVGLGLIIGYCHGTTGFSASYPFAGSALHLDLTTTGPAVLGGVLCTTLGSLLLVWAFLAALVSLFTWSEHTRERVVERYSVVPAPDGNGYAEATEADEEHKHFWSRPARTRI